MFTKQCLAYKIGLRFCSENVAEKIPLHAEGSERLEECGASRRAAIFNRKNFLNDQSRAVACARWHIQNGNPVTYSHWPDYFLVFRFALVIRVERFSIFFSILQECAFWNLKIDVFILKPHSRRTFWWTQIKKLVHSFKVLVEPPCWRCAVEVTRRRKTIFLGNYPQLFDLSTPECSSWMGL